MTDRSETPKSVFDEGIDSCLRGLPKEDCPYPPGAEEREQWIKGWESAAGGEG